MWTAKDDARYFSPIFGLPGYRHTSGVGRSWHFVDVYGFIITGRIFIPLLFVSGQWARMVADSWTVFPSAWNTFVHYANFRFPPEQDGFYAYNPLQPLVYFFIVFVFAPISILLYEGPNLAAFLAEWKNAGERGLETDGRKPL